jgi:hypothetical protein
LPAHKCGRGHNLSVLSDVAVFDRGNLMLLMAILPMMLIATILVVTSLDARGLLGPPRRKVSLHVPLSTIAAGLALAAAAVLAAAARDPLLLGAACFQVGWAIVHARIRTPTTATVGMVGAAGVLVGALAAGAADAALVGFEVALALALVPQVAPTLAARLSERQMKVQRATVLSVFCLSVTALFAVVALTA